MSRFIAFVSFAVVLAAPAHASWVLDNDASRVSFVTTKAGAVAEVHKFTSISGSVSDSGQVGVTIELASVDTMIPIRDERMRDILFETSVFPEATLTASVDAAALSGLAAGESRQMSVSAELAMRNQTQAITLDLVVAKLSDSRLMVSSLQPVVITAAQVDLAEGVEELRDIAGLPSISPAVPVSVVLTFDSAR